jgi:predicted hotdog family 3-hydroxylacyl-ACP dehydratase
MSDYPPLEELVPHRPPMVLLDRLVSWEPGKAVCALTLEKDAPFVEQDCVQTAVSIEYMAQGVAACLGYEALRGGESVRVGMIIGCRKFELATETIPIGTPLEIHVERKRGNENLSHFQCSVSDAERTYATALLTLYHAERPPEDGSF